jgi:hypothetical protein
VQNISGITSFENADITEDMIINPPKYNRSWGIDYILMDSKSFMGSTNGDGYIQVIDMFQKIWNEYNYRLFSVF